MCLALANRGMHGHLQTLCNGLRPEIGKGKTASDAKTISTAGRQPDILLTGEDSFIAITLTRHIVIENTNRATYAKKRQ